MDVVVLIFVSVLLLIGIAGSIVPFLPGPPISFFAILILHFSSPDFNIPDLSFLFFLVLVITFVDYWLQIYGVKKFGGGKKATNGTIIGLILGFFIFPPLGIILGPFLGAFIGAKMEGGKNDSLKIAFGSLLGFLGGVILKIIVSIYIAYCAFQIVFP